MNVPARVWAHPSTGGLTAAASVRPRPLRHRTDGTRTTLLLSFLGTEEPLRARLARNLCAELGGRSQRTKLAPVLPSQSLVLTGAALPARGAAGGVGKVAGVAFGARRVEAGGLVCAQRAGFARAWPMQRRAAQGTREQRAQHTMPRRCVAYLRPGHTRSPASSHPGRMPPRSTLRHTCKPLTRTARHCKSRDRCMAQR